MVERNETLDLNKHAFLINVDEQYNTSTVIEMIKKSVKLTNLANSNQILQMIEKNNYPDLKVIRPEGKNIKKEQLLSLMKDFEKSSYYNWKKIYIIEYAEDLNQYSANTILKFLEEPVGDIVAILVTKNIGKVLETLISRCEIVNLNKYCHKDYDKNLIDKVMGYIEKIEQYNNEAIPYLADLYLIKNDELKDIFEIMILIYDDIVKFCVLNNKINFVEFIERIIKLSNNCNVENIICKIKKIEKMIQYLDYNINNRIIIDSIFIGDNYGK